MSIAAGILMSGDRVGNDDDCRGSSSCLFKSVLPLAVGFMMLTFVLAVLYAVYKRYKNNKELRAMGKGPVGVTRGNNSVVTGLSGSGARVSPIIQVGDQNSDMDTSRAALESLRVSDIEKNLAADQKRNGSGEKQSPVFSTRSNSRDVEKGASY